LSRDRFDVLLQFHNQFEKLEIDILNKKNPLALEARRRQEKYSPLHRKGMYGTSIEN
jgi:hypothetical protein